LVSRIPEKREEDNFKEKNILVQVVFQNVASTRPAIVEDSRITLTSSNNDNKQPGFIPSIKHTA
jgi:hypothetical protein